MQLCLITYTNVSSPQGGGEVGARMQRNKPPEDNGTLSTEELTKIDELTPSTGSFQCEWVEIVRKRPEGHGHGGGDATRPLPRNGRVEELHRDPKSGHILRSGLDVKNERSSTKESALKRLKCGTIQKKVSYILQSVSAGAARRILFLFYPA